MTTPTPAESALQVVLPPGLPHDVAAVLGASPYGPYEVHVAAGRDAVLRRLADAHCDALILRDDEAAVDLAAAAGTDLAVLVVVDPMTPATVLGWLERGAQDVLLDAELAAPTLPLR
ncbi:MAG: hypothetical protein M3O01_03480, partial [Pseudomonadota bacterium]|nr:hypothetical protein [Pseudomonadota bacterium]